MRLSIRWRLTLWITLALAVVLTSFAFLIYGLLRHALFAQTDRLLLTALGQLRSDPRVGTAPDERIHDWIEEFRDHQNFRCVVYRSDGGLYDETPGLAAAGLPAPRSEATGRWADTVSLPELGRQRVMAERMRLGERDFDVLLLAPLETIDRELDQVAAVLYLAGPLTLLLAAGLAYGLARTVLAPVDAIRRATEEITADRLDRRLPVANPYDELGRLARTINATIARLERSFAEVRRFTADASHELRTPLTALRTEVEVALSKPLTVVEYPTVLGNVLEELVRMSRLTDQLLTLSRQDAGVERIAPNSVCLNDVVFGVVEALRALADAKGVQLRFEQQNSVAVLGDEGRLRQVFLNLLDNALKYTPPGGSVTVRVGTDGAVSVEDTGIGIPEEHLPYVFDRFYRVDKARTRAEGGAGLGLSIARSIVLAHGGRIDITSRLGRGTVCTVLLPRQGRGADEENPDAFQPIT